QIDINGDDIVEKLFVQKKNDKVIVAVNSSSLVIDSNNPSDYFAVVDINKNDKYKEIVLGDYGPSDDYTSVFCYYDGKNIINMGKTEGLFNLENTLDGTLTIDSAGKILAMTRSRILQTWSYSKEFTLSKNHYLEAVPRALYPTDDDVFVIQPFNLYLNKGDRNPILPIREGQTLKIIGTDDQAWCLVQTTTGTKGWIAVKNFNVLENNGLKAEETFAGLCNID
ncbi:MAG TPA: SH3 domain-containing protein, partial [Candidatus Deferrimicrobium sp.]|nr:SH3 domain-containing protein [Candidatus Deferrimicrobium sp.]